MKREDNSSTKIINKKMGEEWEFLRLSECQSYSVTEY